MNSDIGLNSYMRFLLYTVIETGKFIFPREKNK